MSSHLGEKIETFTATIQTTQNRHVAIPAAVRKSAGISERPDNDIVQVSLRPHGSGYWNHHYFKLTNSGCFAIPTDITGLSGGDVIDVKLHRVIRDGAPAAADCEPAATALLKFANLATLVGWRSDGSSRVDEYLNEEMLLGE